LDREQELVFFRTEEPQIAQDNSPILNLSMGDGDCISARQRSVVSIKERGKNGRLRGRGGRLNFITQGEVESWRGRVPHGIQNLCGRGRKGDNKRGQKEMVVFLNDFLNTAFSIYTKEQKKKRGS